jgi:hypothetical protein
MARGPENVLRGRNKIFFVGQEYIGHVFLRIAVHQREPGALDLNLKPNPPQEGAHRRDQRRRRAAQPPLWFGPKAGRVQT